MTDKIKLDDLTPLHAADILRSAAKNIRNEEGVLDLTIWGTLDRTLLRPEEVELYSDDETDTATVALMAAPTCGTPACVAGHIAWEASQECSLEGGGYFANRISGLAHEVAIKAAGPQYNPAMFSASYLSWPEERRNRAEEIGEAQAAAEWLEELADEAYARELP